MFRPVALLFPLLLFAGCVSTEYMGKTYPPTDGVDIYFSLGDVEGDYEVMGELQGEAGEYDSFEHMEQEMIKEAMAKGADAIVFEDMDTVTVGSSTTYINRDEKPRYYVDRNGELRREGGRHRTEGAITTDIKNKVVKAELLKYN